MEILKSILLITALVIILAASVMAFIRMRWQRAVNKGDEKHDAEQVKRLNYFVLALYLAGFGMAYIAEYMV